MSSSRSLITLVSIVVAFASVGKPAFATPEPNMDAMKRATKEAYMRTYETKVCVDAVANRRPEMALGFCYSWYMQALDATEKAAAKTFVDVAAAMIDNGIADERY